MATCKTCKYFIDSGEDIDTCVAFSYEQVTHHSYGACFRYIVKETTPPNFNNIRFCAFCVHMDRKNSICTKYAGFKVNAYSVCDSHKYEGEK